METAKWRLVYVRGKECYHCNRFTPVWRKLREAIAERGLPVEPVVWDYEDVDREALRRLEFPGRIPYLVMVREGERDTLVTWKGARTLENLLGFVGSVSTGETDPLP